MKGRLEAAVRQAWEILCHFLWPSTCPVCGRLGTVGCPSCLDGLLVGMQDRCLECGGGPFPCGIASHASFIRTGTWHEGKARDVVHLAKYSGRRKLAFEMGKALARLYHEDRGSVLVPVPLHRDSSRPYNQAEWLARGMATEWGATVVAGLEWTRSVHSQVGRNAFERRALPKGAFRWRGVQVEASVFLVDDVFTTGTTLLRASEALALAGVPLKGAYCWAMSPLETLTVQWREDAVHV